jgi:hypothetical protein
MLVRKPWFFDVFWVPKLEEGNQALPLTWVPQDPFFVAVEVGHFWTSCRKGSDNPFFSAPEMWSHMVTFLVTFNHQKSIKVPQWEREQVWAVPGALGEILSWGRAVVLVVQFLSLPYRQGTRQMKSSRMGKCWNRPKTSLLKMDIEIVSFPMNNCDFP